MLQVGEIGKRLFFFALGGLALDFQGDNLAKSGAGFGGIRIGHSYIYHETQVDAEAHAALVSRLPLRSQHCKGLGRVRDSGRTSAANPTGFRACPAGVGLEGIFASPTLVLL